MKMNKYWILFTIIALIATFYWGYSVGKQKDDIQIVYDTVKLPPEVIEIETTRDSIYEIIKYIKEQHDEEISKIDSMDNSSVLELFYELVYMQSAE